ncbi:Kinesin-like protein [Seminavis robusta]|uniref:Kinesin-like protein n=1 Tax=Seminavis robusta TaxID=568900 RepID=A0A9N8DMK5_9STRA|nr:Kinesin-like protein [Seminavis robusta]|eukprot:Sro229_g093180.1 Kinesin-like protein (477) ;mRNA; r:81685-83115
MATVAGATTSNNKSSSNNKDAAASSKTGPPVQVFVRLRPLIPEEEGHEVIEFKTNDRQSQFQLKQPSQEEAPAKINPVFAGAPPLRRRKDQWKSFDGFNKILKDDKNNEQVYQATIQPLVTAVAEQPNLSACVFTYGHTGSGKSHTLLGYDDELGVYKFAAAEMLEQLADNDDNGKMMLLVRVSELYKDTVHDLLTKEQCSIRQDGKGVVQVRGPMKEDDLGRIDQLPLGKLCSTAPEVVDCVEAAVASRRVGISTHHSQSSRSHLVVELEVVTAELVEQRNLLMTRDAHLTRLKWLQTERSFGKHLDRPMPKWTKPYMDGNAPTKLRKEILQYETLVKESKQCVAKLEKNLGGTLVFCDLAGNEYARDAAGSTKEEMEEAAEINKSLLAVKEMIRSLNNNAKGKGTNHVPYRDSKLTMMLRRHLDNKAVMMAHLSPSQESWRKTINTLTYAALVGQNSKGAVGKRQQGKENKIRQ